MRRYEVHFGSRSLATFGKSHKFRPRLNTLLFGHQNIGLARLALRPTVPPSWESHPF
jgi:hypothetical protein